MRSFDIDIVMVIYNVWENRFRVDDPATKWNLERSLALVLPFVTKQHIPSEMEQRRQFITYKRMKKYAERGFTFINSPGIISDGDNDLYGCNTCETVEPFTYMSDLDAINISFDRENFGMDFSSW